MDKKQNSVLIVDDEALNIVALTHILNPMYTVMYLMPLKRQQSYYLMLYSLM